MDVLTFETCWTLNNEIIKQVTSSWSIFIQLWFIIISHWQRQTHVTTGISSCSVVKLLCSLYQKYPVDSGYKVSCTVPRSVFTVMEVSWKSVNENTWVIHECEFISYSKWPVISTYRLPWLPLISVTQTILISVFLLLFRTWTLFEFFALNGRTSTLLLIFFLFLR